MHFMQVLLNEAEISDITPCKKPKLKYLLIQDTYVCAFAQFGIEGAENES